MSGVLAVERESAMLYEFRRGHVTSLVSCWRGMSAWGWVWRVGLGMVCGVGYGAWGLGKVRVVVCDTRCGVWGIEWGMVLRVVSVRPRWGTRLGEVRVVRVVGPGWWVRLCD
jgi:hypothetical protein